MRAGIGFAFAILLAGCGGMPPQSARTVPATSSVPGAPSAPSTGTTAVRFTITPTKAQSSHSRHAQYISVATQSAGIAIARAGSPTTNAVINCASGSCSGSVDAPIGTDTFTVNLYDQPGAHGTILSAGSTTQTIVQNAANNVFLTFNGVAQTVNLSLDNPNPRIGSGASSKVTALVADPDGYTIIGPGSYDSPVTLTLTDPSGATSLSTVTLHSPSEFSTLNYNGAAKIVATVSASIQGRGSPISVTFKPINIAHEYAIPTAGSAPSALVEGPDNAIWFAEGSGNKIGRIDTSGIITQYATTGTPRNIIVGPDGALWFSEVGSSAGKQYGRVTTAGAVTEYALNPAPAAVAVDGLVFSPDGTRLYLADYSGNSGSIFAVTPATGAILKNYPANDYPAKLVFGADGNLYASESRDIMRVRISDDSTQLLYPSAIGFAPYSLVAGQDGKIWFTELSGQKIGNLTTATGTIAEYTVPIANNMYQIISAADGTLWFTFGIIQNGSGDSCGIGHSTQSGAVSTYVIADCHTSGLAFGADGNIWLTEQNANKIGVFPMP